MRILLQLLSAALVLALFNSSCKQTPAAQTVHSPTELVGEWSIQSILGTPASAASQAYLRFAEDGRLSGSTGLNQISGSWILEANTLTISQLISTLKAGPADLMDQEQRLLKALSRVRGAQLPPGGSLALVGQDGATLAEGLRRESPAQSLQPATLSGTVTYRERMALRAGHRLTVELHDVSRADAPAIVLGRSQAIVDGQPPLAYEISFDPTKIHPRSRYSLRATLHDADGKLAWTTTQAYLVLRPGAPKTGIELLLERLP